MYYASVVYQQSTTITGEGLHVISKLAFADVPLRHWHWLPELSRVGIETRCDFKVRSVGIARNTPWEFLFFSFLPFSFAQSSTLNDGYEKIMGIDRYSCRTTKGVLQKTEEAEKKNLRRIGSSKGWLIVGRSVSRSIFVTG